MRDEVTALECDRRRTPVQLDYMRAEILLTRALLIGESDLFRCLEQHPYWNHVPGGRSSIDDAPQLEYDEHDIDLIADRGKCIPVASDVCACVSIQRADCSLISQEIDDDGLEYGKTTDPLISFLRSLCFDRGERN